MKEKLVKLGLTEDLAQKVVENIGTVLDGEYITKTRFNDVNTELKTANETIKARDKQIEDLGKDSTDIAALKKEKEDLIKANKEAKIESDKALANERKNNSIKMELLDKVHNPNIAMSLLKMDDIVMNEDGTVKSGLKEQLDGLKKTDNYLFIPEKNNQSNNQQNFIKGAKPKDGDDVPPVNLSAGELFAKNLASKANEAVKTSAESIYFGNN